MNDVRFALKRMRHAPGFVILAVLTVALTVGANTAILSIADAVLFRPLPYSDPDRIAIIQLFSHKTGSRYTATPLPFVEAINDCCASVSEVALTGSGPRITIDTPDGPTPVATLAVTPNYFTVLGAQPARGRILHEADLANMSRAAMLSYAGWQQYFGADQSVVGTSVMLGGVPLDVVGVLPRGFVFPSNFAGRPVVITLRPALERGAKGSAFHAIVRLAPGVSRAVAQAEVDAATFPVAQALPGRSDSVPLLEDVRATLYPLGRPVMRYLLAAAALILLLGCANLANMMLVRGRRYAHEAAVRQALGADRARLIRPALIEAGVIGIAGAALAVLLTSLFFDTLLQLVPTAAYGRAPVGVSARVVVTSFSLGVLASLLFGVLPAWRSSALPVHTVLQRRGGGAARRARIGGPMIVVQVAVAIAVIFGAGVAGRAFVNLLQTPLGFSADHVLRIAVAPPQGTADRLAFYERLLDDVRRHPAVISAGAASVLPFSGGTADEGTRSDGQREGIGLVYTLPGFFETVSIEVIQGAAFASGQSQTDPDVALLSQSAARTLFGVEAAVGRTITTGSGRSLRVMGVVRDVQQSFGRADAVRGYFIPSAQATRVMSIVVKTRDESAAVVADLRARVRSAASGVAVASEWWTESVEADALYRDRRFQTVVLSALSVLALGLTILGIATIVLWTVGARSREMGIRLAMGASPPSLIRLIVRQSLVPVAIGAAAGFLLVLWGRKLAEAQFFALDTNDPLMLAVALASVAVAATLAAWLPSRRTTRLNPTDVLRSE